jgi:hypothetical protein
MVAALVGRGGGVRAAACKLLCLEVQCPCCAGLAVQPTARVRQRCSAGTLCTCRCLPTSSVRAVMDARSAQPARQKNPSQHRASCEAVLAWRACVPRSFTGRFEQSRKFSLARRSAEVHVSRLFTRRLRRRAAARFRNEASQANIHQNCTPNFFLQLRESAAAEISEKMSSA